MNYLIDTQALIWYYEGNEQLSHAAKNVIADIDNQLYVSIASLWEMAIKISIGKLLLSNSLESWIEKMEYDDIKVLSILPQHIISLTTLPLHHKDPFDRIIISQAIQEDLVLISSDHIFSQ